MDPATIAVATMADLSSVGIILDHVVCTSGPLLLSQWDHLHHGGFGGVLSPECRISSRHFRGLGLRFPEFVGRLPYRRQSVGSHRLPHLIAVSAPGMTMIGCCRSLWWPPWTPYTTLEMARATRCGG